MTPHPDFEALDVPMSFTLGGYQLDVLTAADLDVDYDAVMRSKGVLQGLFGPDWPEGLTKEYDLTDLHWHHREFTAKRSFAWVIRDGAGLYLGCAYLFPDMATRGVGEAPFWFVDAPDRQAHLAAFGALYETWLSALLPEGYQITLRSNAAL